MCGTAGAGAGAGARGWAQAWAQARAPAWVLARAQAQALLSVRDPVVHAAAASSASARLVGLIGPYIIVHTRIPQHGLHHGGQQRRWQVHILMLRLLS